MQNVIGENESSNEHHNGKM